MWSGMVRERFLERFEETQPRMIETLEHLTHIAKELRDIGVRFQQADERSGSGRYLSYDVYRAESSE
ncbi:hypothetical protein [Paenibacillus sp. FSL M8-0212]|uniref:hypothetical protein n=1 Tax=Paenibacillus sp. FSL M8-0212 TaxID=2921618 RepID=UPI004046F50D